MHCQRLTERSKAKKQNKTKLDIDLPVKGSFAQCLSSNLTHEIGKYDFKGGRVNHTDNLPSNLQVPVTPNCLYDLPPLKSAVSICPKLSVRFTPPEISSVNLPQIICTIYHPPPKSAVSICPKSSVRFTSTAPPPKLPILSKFSNAHNIMLCFTKVFSAKDQQSILSRTGLCSCNRDLGMVFCVFKCNFELFENLHTARNCEILNGTLNCFIFQRRQKVMLEFLNSFTMSKAMNISQIITTIPSETIIYNLKSQLVVS